MNITSGQSYRNRHATWQYRVVRAVCEAGLVTHDILIP